MLRLIIIDDAFCKKETDRFISRHKAVVKADECTNVLMEKMMQFSTIKALSSKIALNTRTTVNLVDTSEIIRLESKRNATKFHFTDKKNIVLTKTLLEYESLFVPRGFFRTHKSHLINITFMSSFLKEEGFVLMKDGSKVPVSLRKKEHLFKELKKL